MGSITKEKAKAFITEYVGAEFNGWDGNHEACVAFVDKYHKNDTLFIRPSGNPLSNESYVGMLRGDVTNMSSSLVSIDSVAILAGGKVAVVFCTTDSYFTYKGTKNEDRSKFSYVLEDVDGVIKVAHAHRTTGQPIPK